MFSTILAEERKGSLRFIVEQGLLPQVCVIKMKSESFEELEH